MELEFQKHKLRLLIISFSVSSFAFRLFHIQKKSLKQCVFTLFPVYSRKKNEKKMMKLRKGWARSTGRLEPPDSEALRDFPGGAPRAICSQHYPLSFSSPLCSKSKTSILGRDSALGKGSWTFHESGFAPFVFSVHLCVLLTYPG